MKKIYLIVLSLDDHSKNLSPLCGRYGIRGGYCLYFRKFSFMKNIIYLNVVKIRKWSNLMFVNCFVLCFEHCWYLWSMSTMMICCKNTHCKMGHHMFRKEKETSANMKEFLAILFHIYLSIYICLVITKHWEYLQCRLVKLLSKRI